jgi:isopentenyl-diphosphate delta-isomerase
LNPLQEVFQTGGNTNFSGLLKKIEKVCSSIKYSVIVKEVGYGISATVAEKLRDAGVYGIDVAGSGSVSWSSLESKRSNDVVVKNSAQAFADWGNSTAGCVESSARVLNEGIKIIACGGIKTGVDMAKALALGANLCGNATDFLRKITVSRTECEVFINSLIFELKTAMFCVGCKNVEELKSAKLAKL